MECSTDAAFHARPRHLADVRDCDRRHLPRIAGVGKRQGVWVTGMGGECRCNGESGRVEGGGIEEMRPALGQGAGLVEDDMVHLDQALKAAAILQHDAGFEQAARSHDLHHRHGKAQRAGTGDDEDGDGDGERLVEIARDDHPADKGEEGRHMDDGRVKLCGAIGDATVLGTAAFRRFHHSCHLGKERVFRHRHRLDHQRVVEIERTSLQPVTRCHGARPAFAGNEGTIQIRLAVDHLGIDRHALAGGQEQAQARCDFANRAVFAAAIGKKDERPA